MKPPVEPTSNSPMAGTASDAAQQKPAIAPPTEPFINLSGDGPVDPTKFQRFIIPMEFIQKANSVELPGLDPDDLRDTGEQSPMEPSSSRAPLLPNERTEAHAAVKPPAATITGTHDRPDVATVGELLATTQRVARRPLGPFARWSLTGKMPAGVRVAIAVTVAIFCILILSFTHLKSSNDSAASVEPAISELAASASQSPKPPVAALPSAVLPRSTLASAKQTQAEPTARNGNVGAGSEKKTSGRASSRSKLSLSQPGTNTGKPQASASPAATASASPRRKGSFWTPIDSVD